MESVAEQVIDVLRARIPQPPPGIDERTELSDLALDSLTLLEVSFGLQARFPGLDEERVVGAGTVGDLIDAARAANG